MCFIKPFDAVDVIGGVYKGLHGKVTKVTEAMVYVELVGLDGNRRVHKRNVVLSLQQPLSVEVDKETADKDCSLLMAATLKRVKENINAFSAECVNYSVVNGLEERWKAVKLLNLTKEKFADLEKRPSTLVLIRVTGGKFKGMQGVVTGVTKNMFYVKLDGVGEEKQIMKSSVDRKSEVSNELLVEQWAELDMLENK